jgi:TIGR00251 family protein
LSATHLRLRVVPNAKRSEVVGEHGEAIKVKIQAAAMDGKANDAVLAFLAKKFGIPRRDVALVAGEKSRDKTVTIEGLDPVEARRRLLAD